MKTPNAETIFNEALAIRSDEERVGYLRGACGGDADLFAKVERLLQAHGRSGQFMPTEPGDSPTVLAPAPITEGPGTRIGRYKLLQQIGEGGMGVVYMADQEEAVRRRVALKVIKLGMDTKQVVARFEAERQALALMDHPNIAKVLDGGATDTGRPYFVMELVQGVPITEFCDKAKLSAKERLKLFMQVCQAIQSAHQKGIIHRDIKPSNVLITMHNGEPMPKVIDFGIAKATNQKLTEKTLFTNFASMIGTPAYMSPEQAEMSSMDVDTRADIYSLGVLLYALLTGTTPFPEKRLRSLGYGEMQRVIREEEPERPSTRLSTMANEQKTIVAKNCGEELASLSNLLKGDLDWIVMKCLEKDRQRRYETANGLAADIQRHLGNEPVIARPPSAGYRFQKTVRRNKLAFAAGAAIALTLVTALAFSTAAFVRERRARLQASVAERAREEARQATQAETVRAETLAKFSTGFFDSVVPDLYQQGHRESIRRLLENADRLATDLTNAPLAEAQLRFVIASAYDGILFEKPPAIQQFRAVELLASRLGSTGQVLGELARLRERGSIMWERTDKNIARELAAYAETALKRTPPDYHSASFGFSSAAEFETFNGSSEEAERLAREAVRAVSVGGGDLAEKAGALYLVIQLTSKRGALADAERAADDFFGTLQALNLSHQDKKRRRGLEFLNTIWINDWTRLPEASVRKALTKLDPKDDMMRGHLQRYLGMTVARRGDWREGLKLIQQAPTDFANSVELWNTEIQLAALLEDSESQRSLMIAGLSHFAATADGVACLRLVEPLLILSSDPAFLPTIAGLVKRAQEIQQPWERSFSVLVLAQMMANTGRLQEAKKSLQNYLKEDSRNLESRLDPERARSLFFLSSVEMRLKNITASREAYKQGLQLHTAAMRGPGTPYTGDDWNIACTAELLRREAASLLGNNVPTAP